MPTIIFEIIFDLFHIHVFDKICFDLKGKDEQKDEHVRDLKSHLQQYILKMNKVFQLRQILPL